MSLPGDVFYITNVQPWVIIDVQAGCLVEFLFFFLSFFLFFFLLVGG